MDAETFSAVVRRRFQAIPGSRLLRTACARCGQAVQVTGERAAKSMQGHYYRILCDSCSPSQPCDKGAVLTPRQAAVLGKTRS